MSRRRPALLAALALTTLVAAGSVAVDAAAPPPEARLDLLTSGWDGADAPDAFTDLRRMNPEYDFMARTFTVLALADRSLADPETADANLVVMDAILTDTLRYGEHRHWLLGYADANPWRGDGRSLFVDGELLVMLGARRLVRDDSDAWRAEMQARAAAVTGNLGSVTGYPIAESYPDEGWTFCHVMAHVGLRMHEVLDGADHAARRDDFLAFARGHLVHADTGMLSSEFTLRGEVHDGPEGSSLWFTTTGLQLLDPELGRSQYALARKELGRTLLGWGYAREWPEGHGAAHDVDSGPIVPGLEASASSSGLAIAASAAYGDAKWNRQLVRALGAAEAVMSVDPVLAEAADNAIGASVVSWGLGFGPLWARIGPPVKRP
jgi:hypothetical protein